MLLVIQSCVFNKWTLVKTRVLVHMLVPSDQYALPFIRFGLEIAARCKANLDCDTPFCRCKLVVKLTITTIMDAYACMYVRMYVCTFNNGIDILVPAHTAPLYFP